MSIGEGKMTLQFCSSWFLQRRLEKRGAHQLVHGDLQNNSTRYWNNLEDYWPCAGGLSAVNAIVRNCVTRLTRD